MTDLTSLTSLAGALITAGTSRNKMIATAESCTGGLIVGLLTEIPGSSAVVDRGFVTYSNEAKVDMLGVDEDLITKFGAVSEQVAIAMVDGAIERSKADIAVSVTGVAGPGGGTDDKPVGLVHFGVKQRGETATHFERRFGAVGRSGIRMATVCEALMLLREII